MTSARSADLLGTTKIRSSVAIWARALAGLLVALAVAGCDTTPPALHYRLTVVVDTPQGRRSGSSVVEFRASSSPGFPGPEAQGVNSLVLGEATPVKLSDGRFIFAILKWRQPDGALPMLIESFADLLPPRSATVDGKEVNRQLMEQVRALAEVRATRPVKPQYYPVLAYFGDVARPGTIRATVGSPGASIAPGVRLVGMTLEITDALATRQLESILPWLNRRDLGYLDPEVHNNSTTKFDEFRYIQTDNFSSMPRHR